MQELIFVIDPMCSWCWGFHPIIETLRKEHKGTYRFSLVVGGLRTKGDMLWNEKSRTYLEENWKRIESLTQQPFSTKLLEKTTFEYDTYPACKALVTVRELWGKEASFEYLYALQKAFYKEGQDISNINVLKSFVKHEELSRFENFFRSERAETLMQHDFAKARSMGANAFPSVVKIDSSGHMVCKKGYQSLEEILEL